ncbi:hypothetical protein SpCBS45565_g06930 [Spizellomyces sp. 'palustris']|nr:hypothetical protein SpCBS45565_g06930 [Spizellomyces sp. 'palustris']
MRTNSILLPSYPSFLFHLLLLLVESVHSAPQPSRFHLTHILKHGYTQEGATQKSYLKSYDLSQLQHRPVYPTVKHHPGTVNVWSEWRGQSIQQVHVKEKPIRIPDHTDPETVLSLGLMTHDAYLEPDDKGWVDIPGWNQTVRWKGEGKSLASYVFLDEDEEVLVIVLKGTTLATPVGGGPSSNEDKYNDNIMFSCCCAKAGWGWKPICDCPTGKNECDMKCLIQNSNFDGSYYNLAQTMYLAVREWFPSRVSIWLAGHSLGGALASLIALTNDLPAFAYEAPGDLTYALRLGLLPSLPPDQKPDYTDFLKTLPIYHFGNTGDPIYLGQCNGPTSSCWWFDYALETKCHTGYECVYDINSPPPLLLLQDQPTTAQLSVRYHTIDFVIKTFLEKSKTVPECKVVDNCLAEECQAWKYI